jgi:Clp amino terminal domain, pathogenicity island component
MNPGPTVEQLIQTVHADAASDDPLAQLSTAARTAVDLEEVADGTLAHFVEKCRRSGRSWTEISKALGVTKQAAHKRFSVATASGLERFTPRAHAALRAAAEAARSLGHNYVGTEHVLLGLYEPSGGIAARILGEAGITRAKVEEQILTVTPRSASATPDSDPPLTPRADDALERARTEALALGHNYVGTEHLLLALFGDPESLATETLVHLGGDRAKFKERAVEMLSGYNKLIG